jgi:hypothetical protein
MGPCFETPLMRSTIDGVPAEALALLSPELRATLTALRASLPPERLDYAAMGTPTPGLAAHLAAAVPCALALARRTGAG